MIVLLEHDTTKEEIHFRDLHQRLYRYLSLLFHIGWVSLWGAMVWCVGVPGALVHNGCQWAPIFLQAFLRVGDIKATSCWKILAP